MPINRPLAQQLKAYLVLDPQLCGEYGMLNTAIDAARAGVSMVQLRAPQWKKRALAECARELLRALSPMGVPLIINDHVDVAVAVRAQGVHVGQSDLSPEDTRALLLPGQILGLSVSSLAECPQDNRLVDYIGVGPVWATQTKTDAAPALGLDGLKAVVLRSPCPSVAIGSIQAKNLTQVKQTGVNGFAVVSAICGQPSPYEAALTLVQQWDAA